MLQKWLPTLCVWLQKETIMTYWIKEAEPPGKRAIAQASAFSHTSGPIISCSSQVRDIRVPTATKLGKMFMKPKECIIRIITGIADELYLMVPGIRVQINFPMP